MPELKGGSYQEGYGLKFEWGPDAEVEEVSSSMDIPVPPAERKKRIVSSSRTKKDTETLGAENDQTLAPQLSREVLIAGGAYPRSEISPEQKVYIEEILNAEILNDAQKRVLYMRLIERRTLEEVANLLGYQSKEMPRRFQNAALWKLLKRGYVSKEAYYALKDLLGHWA